MDNRSRGALVSPFAPGFVPPGGSDAAETGSCDGIRARGMPHPMSGDLTAGCRRSYPSPGKGAASTGDAVEVPRRLE
jgi:hypothetical protein